MTEANSAAGSPATPAPAQPWPRIALIAAALIETLGAVNDLPILFVDTSEVPGSGLGGWIITAKLALTPVAAIAALVFALKGRMRHALVAMAAVIVLTWLSYLPSVAIHGLDFEGSLAVVLQMMFQIGLAPFIAATVAALAVRDQRLPFATFLAVLPTLVSVLSIAAFAIGVAIYGF
jgi:hypothetical protein